MTLSFIESHYPEKLIKHLKNTRRYTVEKTSSGIYTVYGDILPIQLIDSRQLTVDENLWLKGLSNQLDPWAIRQISNEVVRQDKAARIQAYLYAITQANARAIKEAMTMGDDDITLDEVIESTGLAAKWEARAEERKALAIAKNMVNMGFPMETIISATHLDPEKAKELYQQN